MANYRIRPNLATSIRPSATLRYQESPVPQIGSKVLKFKPSIALDVKGYRLRVAPDGGPGSASRYALAFIDLGKPAPDAQGFISVDLSTLPATAALDGVYDLAVTAYDDAVPLPNESSFMTLENAALDFVAPEPPSELSIL